MSSSKLPLHVLQELPDITDIITSPLKSSQRIKYTCFDVSKTLVVLGATSGGIYVFNRNPCEFVQLIPNKDGAITRLAISPDEKHIGFANGKGTVTVTAQTLSGSHKTVSSREHHGNEVTALAWSNMSMLFCGDDVGKVSALQLPNFITKTMFQSSSQTIMSLDSRICQIDIKDNMLLVSTLTRCYICDTLKEQYRQIGQKLRDGEYGACFVTTDRKVENGTTELNNKETIPTEVKQFNIVDGNEAFAVNEKLANVAIFCARPSSRLWEASIDGTVQRTHQFKQVLARQPMKVISNESYSNENVSIERFVSNDTEGQSYSFPKIFNINHSAIVSFKKDALFFMDFRDVDNTMWFDTYKEIVDCKIYHDFVYLWLQNGHLVCLRRMKIDKFLIKCFLDEKYVLCAELCALFSSYFLTNCSVSNKLNILVGLRNKQTVTAEVEEVLKKFESLKSNLANTSGIYVVDNTYHNRESLLSECDEDQSNGESKYSTEPLQSFKDLMSTSVTDTLNSSKKILKEKWEDFEEKMKHLSGEKQQTQESVVPKKIIEETTFIDKVTSSEILNDNHEQEEGVAHYENDIVYKESSHKAIEVAIEDLERINTISEKDKICRALYQHFRISLLDEDTKNTNLLDLIDNYSCDINEIFELMMLFQEYCVKIGALEESNYAPNKLFLSYLNQAPKKYDLINKIINEESLYKYFVDSCISVNTKTQQLSKVGCECGFPLPYTKTQQDPEFSEIIDIFIEIQWASQTKEQCYDMCKKMPYLWRKILYLRRNEDLKHILMLLLQMLDEKLLHSFLPQFTLETWDKAVQLYAVLHGNRCLNCNKVFDHISVKQALCWDDIGAMMIKTIGGKNAVKVMEKNSYVLGAGEIGTRFYHACLLAAIYEKYDASIVGQLTDTIYSSHGSEEARIEICKLIKSSVNGTSNHTALPLIVAANSQHWGLANKFKQHVTTISTVPADSTTPPHVSLEEVLDILDGNTDCNLCGLPLVNEVLIKDGGLWAFKCGHMFHGSCLDLNKLKLCSSCVV